MPKWQIITDLEEVSLTSSCINLFYFSGPRKRERTRTAKIQPDLRLLRSNITNSIALKKFKLYEPFRTLHLGLKCQINANELEPWISFILNRFGTSKFNRSNNHNKLKLKPDCIKFLLLKFTTSSHKCTELTITVLTIQFFTHDTRMQSSLM